MPARTAPRTKARKAAPRAASVDRETPRPSHLDERGRARMVDVGAKPETQREAVARGRMFMHADTLALLRKHDTKKGDVLTVAKIAAISGAKRTSDLIPMAHAVALDGIVHDAGHSGSHALAQIAKRVVNANVSAGRTGTSPCRRPSRSCRDAGCAGRRRTGSRSP